MDNEDGKIDSFQEAILQDRMTTQSMSKFFNWVIIGFSFLIFILALGLTPEGALDGDNDD